MTRDVVVDASVWVNSLVPSDVNHVRCLAWFRAQASDGGALVAPALLLPELAGSISRRTGDRTMALDIVARLVASPNLRLEAVDEPMGTLAARLAAEHGLRGADAVYVATAFRLGLPLVSLDRQQLDRAQAVVTVISP